VAQNYDGETDAMVKRLREEGASWKDIAFRTGRSVFSLMQRRCALSSKGRISEAVAYTSKPWSVTEGAKLGALREQGLPWAKIAQEMPGRTKRALTGRYYRTINRTS